MAKRTWVDICQRAVGENSLSGFGPMTLMNRPVRALKEMPLGRAACGVMWGLGARYPRLPDSLFSCSFYGSNGISCHKYDTVTEIFYGR